MLGLTSSRERLLLPLLAGWFLACSDGGPKPAGASGGVVSAGGIGAGGSSSGAGGAVGGRGAGGSGGKRTSPTYTSDGLACWEYIKAYCNRRDECRGVEDRECLLSARKCPMAYMSEGSTRTAESLRECARSWASFDCDKLLRGWTIPCATPGTLAAGEKCQFNAQCVSLVCYVDTDVIGTCTRTASPGEVCSRTVSCPNGQTCEEGTCGPRPMPTLDSLKGPVGDVGAPCKRFENCKHGEFCELVDSSATTGRCAVPPKAGTPCGKKYGGSIYPEECDDASYCGRDRTCHARPSLGEVCAELGNYQYPCAAGAYCNQASEKCESTKAPGATCDGKVGYTTTLEREVLECDTSLGAECICSSGEKYCDAESGKCVVPVDPGEACDFEWSYCSYGSTCVNARCDYPRP